MENIVKWVRGRRAEKTLFTLFDHLSVKPVPKGTALILGAWYGLVSLSDKLYAA